MLLSAQTKLQHDAYYYYIFFIICFNSSLNFVYALFIMQMRHMKLRISLYYSWYTTLSITNPTPLKNNLALEICKKEIHKDWFVIRLLVYNRFKIQRFIYF
jgi:hypothetical protein